MCSASRYIRSFLVFHFLVLFLGFCDPLVSFALTKPKELKAGYISKDDKLSIVWKKVSGANKYSVFVSDTKGKVIFRGEPLSPKIKLKTKGFRTGSRFRIKVSAKNSSGHESAASYVEYYHQLSRLSGEGRLLTTTSAGRSGYYFLPPDFENQPKPLLVAFHGYGASGQAMVAALREVAKEFGIIIVAPDSGVHNGMTTWDIGTSPNSFTDDFFHIEKCIDELLAFKKVIVNAQHVLAAGHSAGGYAAPYYATNKSEFTAFATLHGGFFLGGFGNRIIPAWLSTGTQDTLAPVQSMLSSAAQLEQAGFTNVLFRAFDVEHGLNQEEVKALVEWWLKGNTS